MRVSHDQLFKEVGLAFPGNLVSLTLPYLAKRIDLSALDFETSRERFDDVLRGRRWFPDLVATVRSRTDPEERALAHLEIEYKYRSQKLGALNEYNRVLARGSGLLVHTAVIYLHGGRPGLVENEWRDVSFSRELRRFRYHSLGLSGALAQEYLERPEPLAWAFAVLMRAEGFASRGELALACVRRVLGASELDDERRSKLLNFVQTYVKLDEKTAPEFTALLRESENQEVREMFMTWADEIKEEGRKEGRLEGMRELVLQLAAQRFGQLSERTRKAIAAITSLDDLTVLARKVLQVDSPDELRIG